MLASCYFFVESFDLILESQAVLYHSFFFCETIEVRRETLVTLHLRGHDLTKLSEKHTLSTDDFNMTIKIVETMRVESSRVEQVSDWCKCFLIDRSLSLSNSVE